MTYIITTWAACPPTMRVADWPDMPHFLEGLVVVVVLLVVVLLVVLVDVVVVVVLVGNETGLLVVVDNDGLLVSSQHKVKSKLSNPQGDSIAFSRKFITLLVKPNLRMAVKTLPHCESKI